MKHKDEPREIKHENIVGIKITRWRVGPKTETSWTVWPRYWPQGGFKVKK